MSGMGDNEPRSGEASGLGGELDNSSLPDPIVDEVLTPPALRDAAVGDDTGQLFWRDDKEYADRQALKAGRRLRRSVRANQLMRWLHIYTSMIGLLVVLFFAATGLTLNHPEWGLGDGIRRDTYAGELPAGYTRNGEVDFLVISEYLRSDYDVGGSVIEHSLLDDEGSISYRGPGYAAAVVFSTSDGSFELTVEQQGIVAVMNDLHRGSDAPRSWRWVIDVSAGLLVLVAVTGLGIQLFQQSRRVRALIVVLLAAIAAGAMTYFALQ